MQLSGGTMLSCIFKDYDWAKNQHNHNKFRHITYLPFHNSIYTHFLYTRNLEQNARPS